MTTNYSITATLTDSTTNPITINTSDTNGLNNVFYVTLNDNYISPSLTQQTLSQTVFYTVNTNNSINSIYNFAYDDNNVGSNNPNICKLITSTTSQTINIYDIQTCSSSGATSFSGQGIVTSSTSGSTYSGISLTMSQDLATTTLTCSNYNYNSSYNTPQNSTAYNTTYTFNFGNSQIVTITINQTYTTSDLWQINYLTITNNNNLATNNQIGIAIGALSNIFFWYRV